MSVAAIGGCGFGPGESSPGEAELRVTREFGTIPMVDATLEDPTESDNVVRFLDDNADIETSFGGNFVDSIDGYAGSTSGGGDEDWFFFVNGYYSDIGAGETAVLPGDRIWWDYRYWSAAYRVPAVVGSWPEPFLHGYDGQGLRHGRRVRRPRDRRSLRGGDRIIEGSRGRAAGRPGSRGRSSTPRSCASSSVRGSRSGPTRPPGRSSRGPSRAASTGAWPPAATAGDSRRTIPAAIP